MSIIALVVSFPTLTHADTFTCTAGDVGCLIASIAKSNANGPAHDYLFLRAGTYMLNRVDNTSPVGDGPNGLPVVTGALTIVGAGQGVTLLARDQSAPVFRFFEVAPTGGLTVAYVTLQGGEVSIPFFQRGGCLFNRGSAMLYHSTIRECSAHVSGAIHNFGQLTLFHTTMIDNFAENACGGLGGGGSTLIESSWIGSNVAEIDGGICAGGAMKIVRSVIQDNVTVLGNGGGLGASGTVEIDSSLISYNVSSLRGGGLDVIDGEVDISRSTFWGNEAAHDGGGIHASGGQVTLHGVAIVFNSAGFQGIGNGTGGGIATTLQGQVHLENTWLLWNEAAQGTQCVGNVTASGWVVSGNPGAFDTGSPCD